MKNENATAPFGIRYFADTADVSAVGNLLSYYPIAGVTTNPTILSRIGGNPMETLLSLRKEAGDRLLFAQVTAADCNGMAEEARLLCKRLGNPVSIKIPATKEGLKAIAAVSRENISVTATAVYKPQQALLCALAGASFVAPYISHIDNLCMDSAEVISEMADLLAASGTKTEILAASFRTAEQVQRILLAGASCVTVTPDMLNTLFEADGTKAEVASFEKNWNGVWDKSIGAYLQ